VKGIGSADGGRKRVNLFLGEQRAQQRQLVWQLGTAKLDQDETCSVTKACARCRSSIARRPGGSKGSSTKDPVGA
jgi:hypothetical protein